MKKSVSILSIMLVGVMSSFSSNGAPMTSQIQRLLNQKEEKIKKLEECEGKKKGWMIAGISTIGLTAVGVGVNIAQASKSNRLSSEIESTKTELERQEEALSGIQSNIAQKKREKEESEKRQLISSWTGAVVGGPCGDAEGAKWTIATDGATECLDGNAVKHLCNCVAKTTSTYKGNQPRNPDGKIGEQCDDGKGVWTLGGDGDNWCTDESGTASFKCVCEPNANGSKGGGGSKGGKKDGGKDEKGDKTCVKSHGEKLTDGCICEPDVGLSVLRHSDGDYCECYGEAWGDNSWDGEKCTKSGEDGKKDGGRNDDKENKTDRVLKEPCVEKDLQYPAKAGVYVNGNKFWCKKLPGSDKAEYPCSCKITSCEDGYHASAEKGICEKDKQKDDGKKGENTSKGGKKDGGKDEKGDKTCVKSHGEKLTDDCICEPDVGLSVLRHSDGDYCECYGEAWGDNSWDGEKCTKSGEDGKKDGDKCIKTYGDYLEPGCVCASGVGLSSILDDTVGKRYCGCQGGKDWNGEKCAKSAENNKTSNQKDAKENGGYLDPTGKSALPQGMDYWVNSEIESAEKEYTPERPNNKKNEQKDKGGVFDRFSESKSTADSSWDKYGTATSESGQPNPNIGGLAGVVNEKKGTSGDVSNNNGMPLDPVGKAGLPQDMNYWVNSAETKSTKSPYKPEISKTESETGRVLNMLCVEKDLQYPAKAGVYVNGGKLLCKGLLSSGAATYPCSCKITSCEDGYHVSTEKGICEKDD